MMEGVIDLRKILDFSVIANNERTNGFQMKTDVVPQIGSTIHRMEEGRYKDYKVVDITHDYRNNQLYKIWISLEEK